jgi:hypothetical protein
MISGKSGLAGKLLAAGRDIDLECMRAHPPVLNFSYSKEGSARLQQSEAN